MKGYAKVSKADIQKAIENYKAQNDRAKLIRDRAVNIYYIRKYIEGGWFIRWRKKGLTPIDFALSMCPSFTYLYEHIGHLVTNEEYGIWRDFTWGKGSDAFAACKALVRGGGEYSILLDNELCSWVNKWKVENV